MGCYRKGEAEDPEVYVTSVATVLAAYPEDVVRFVTHPNFGLPAKSKWLPTVAEVKAACEAEMKPRYEQLRRLRQDEQRRGLLAAPPISEEQRRRAVERWETEIRPALDPRSTAPKAEGKEKIRDRLMEMGGLSQADWDAIPDAKSTAVHISQAAE